MTAQPKLRVRFPATDIFDTPEDGRICEVSDGVLYVTPPPAFGRQSVIGTLLFFLVGYIRPRNLGKVVPAPTGVVLDDEELTPEHFRSIATLTALVVSKSNGHFGA